MSLESLETGAMQVDLEIIIMAEEARAARDTWLAWQEKLSQLPSGVLEDMLVHEGDVLKQDEKAFTAVVLDRDEVAIRSAKTERASRRGLIDELQRMQPRQYAAELRERGQLKHDGKDDIIYKRRRQLLQRAHVLDMVGLESVS
jgi:hypothetical protein